MFSVRFFPWLAGRNFYGRLLHGRGIESTIARADASLLHRSTSELERYFSRPSSEFPRQNAFPVVFRQQKTR
ncbi:protein of unknown function [Serratia sp. Tan611]|nr:protein of unknown function [Serratia sp. Tan611]